MGEAPRVVPLTKRERELVADYVRMKLGFVHPATCHEIVRKAIRFALQERRPEFEEFLKRGG